MRRCLIVLLIGSCLWLCSGEGVISSSPRCKVAVEVDGSKLEPGFWTFSEQGSVLSTSFGKITLADNTSTYITDDVIIIVRDGGLNAINKRFITKTQARTNN
jgi:hypothetical protein